MYEEGPVHIANGRKLSASGELRWPWAVCGCQAACSVSWRPTLPVTARFRPARFWPRWYEGGDIQPRWSKKKISVAKSVKLHLKAGKAYRKHWSHYSFYHKGKHNLNVIVKNWDFQTKKKKTTSRLIHHSCRRSEGVKKYVSWSFKVCSQIWANDLAFRCHEKLKWLFLSNHNLHDIL